MIQDFFAASSGSKNAAAFHSSQSVVPPHLQVIQEPGEVQAPFSSIPVVIGTDVFEASISKHSVVVLWEEEERTADV